jgi:voltage-gated potassium channel
LTDVTATDEAKAPLRTQLRRLYDGKSKAAARFRYGLLAFDALMVIFIVASSFFEGSWVVELLDVVFGVGVLADFSARIWIARDLKTELLHPTGLADIIVVVSLLAPLVGENLAFFRVLRALRVVRSYRFVSRLKSDVALIRQRESVLTAGVHLFVFIFIMTAIVYESQHRKNPDIQNYADALYFTVTALTTTGFGDVTLPGTWGRLLSVLIMIFGVTLFIRLIRELFQSPKRRWRCESCGLSLHDPDAIHCKHCGEALQMPHDGE